MEINRIRDISTFVTTVKYGSYTQAAKHLGVTRSTVGKSIVRLEQAMGVRLLNRTTRSLSTTDEGKVFYEYSHSIMEELNTMTSVMDSRRAYPTGTLKLTAPHSLGHTTKSRIFYRSITTGHPKNQATMRELINRCRLFRSMNRIS